MLGMIWADLGSMRWPMAFSLIVAALLTCWAAGKLMRPGAAPDLRTKAMVDAVLFWGGFAAVSGALGAIIGIIITLQRIEAAGAVTTTLVAGGWKVGLLSSGIGLMILGACALLWFVLQLRWRFLMADAATIGQG